MLEATDWHMLLLGRHRFGLDAPLEGLEGEHDLVRAGFSSCLHAYCVSSRGAERLLELTVPGEEPLLHMVPIDEWLPGVPKML